MCADRPSDEDASIRARADVSSDTGRIGKDVKSPLELHKDKNGVQGVN